MQMTSETECIPFRPLELMLDENVTKASFSDWIGVWPNFMSASVCDKYIEWYNRQRDPSSGSYTNLGDGRHQFPNGSSGRQDTQILVNHNDNDLTSHCNQHIQSCLGHYLHEYGQISHESLMSNAVKFQHTPAGGGYHVWHYEAGGLQHCHRMLVWAIYLNDIPPEDGGETEFFYQKRRINPTKGTVTIWPASFTHTHRGNLLFKGDKYILTGWYHLNA